MKYKIDTSLASQSINNLNDAITYLNTSLDYVNKALEKLDGDELDGEVIKACYALLKILQTQHTNLLSSAKDNYECIEKLISNVDKFNDEGTIAQEWK